MTRPPHHVGQPRRVAGVGHLQQLHARALGEALRYDDAGRASARIGDVARLGLRCGDEVVRDDTCRMGYAREYQVERLFRESILPRIAPVTEQLILSSIAERVLGLPKSY